MTREAVCIHIYNYAARVKKVINHCQRFSKRFHNTVHRQSFHFDTDTEDTCTGPAYTGKRVVLCVGDQCDGAIPSA